MPPGDNPCTVGLLSDKLIISIPADLIDRAAVAMEFSSLAPLTRPEKRMTPDTRPVDPQRQASSLTLQLLKDIFPLK
jgi:hypothetical protein